MYPKTHPSPHPIHCTCLWAHGKEQWASPRTAHIHASARQVRGGHTQSPGCSTVPRQKGSLQVAVVCAETLLPFLRVTRTTCHPPHLTLAASWDDLVQEEPTLKRAPKAVTITGA